MKTKWEKVWDRANRLGGVQCSPDRRVLAFKFAKDSQYDNFALFLNRIGVEWQDWSNAVSMYVKDL